MSFLHVPDTAVPLVHVITACSVLRRLYEVLETLSRIHLVMEHAPGGELFHKITTEGRMSEQRAKPLVAQLVSAIQHLVSDSLSFTTSLICQHFVRISRLVATI